MIKQVGVLDKGYVALLLTMPESDLDSHVVQMARTSFLGETKGYEQDMKLLKYLINNKHLSPLEHVKFTFKVKAPLLVARQWMRYRAGVFSEQSYRYTEAEEDDFYIPTEWRTQSNDNKQGSDGVIPSIAQSIALTNGLNYQIDNAFFWYKIALDLGVAREQARLFLPAFALYTTFIWTVDLRNLVHFLDERTDEHAQYEIRQYALAIKDMVSELAPKTMEYVYG